MFIFQVKLDHSPQFAFGIKHSPYLGSLRGDAWGGSKSEAMGIASRYKHGHIFLKKYQFSSSSPKLLEICKKCVVMFSNFLEIHKK